jgi:hypothetical protein
MLKDIEWQELDLISDSPLLGDDNLLLKRIIAVGNAIVFDAVKYLETSGGEIDTGLKLLIDRFNFSWVRLPLSVRPMEKMDVRFLACDISLKSENNQAECWSMMPEKIEQAIKMSTSSKLNSKLKVTFAEAGAEKGASEEYVEFQPNITAYGIGTNEPAWEFMPVKGRKLNGIQLLTMIVKNPKGKSWTGEVKIKCDIIKKGLLFNKVAVNREKQDVVQEIDFSI